MPRLPQSLPVFLLLGLLPPALLAQPSRPSPPASAPTASASSGAVATEEAQRRYSRALELFGEGSYDAALLEFRRAYELAPSWRILYNIGQVNVQLNDYARALETFERYLKEGGDEVPAARVTEVKSQIDRLRSRVAYFEVTTNVPDATVTIDDLPVGKTPLAQPLLVNAGRRRVGVSAASRLPQNRVVEAAGGDRVKLDFDLPSTEIAIPTFVASASAAPTGPQAHIFWPGWAATGGLAVGAAVTGILALSATSTYNNELNSFPAQVSTLEDDRRKARTLSVVSDVLTGLAVVSGGVSLYLSLRKRAPEAPPSAATSLSLRVGPGSLGLSGSF